MSEFAPRFDSCMCTDTRVGRVAFPVTDIYLYDALTECGDYCYGEMKTYRSFLKPGMTIIDVGANIGLMSLLFSEIAGGDGTVIAFEPSVFANGLLRHNLDVNDCSNVTIYRKAVSDRAGKTTFVDPDTAKISQLNFGSLSLGRRIKEGLGQNVPTDVTTIDALELTDCDFIKIDVEGAEAAVIRGARDTLTKHRPFLSIETDNPDGDLSWMSDLLDLNYRVFLSSFVLHSWPNFKGAAVDHLPRVVCANAIAVPDRFDPDVVLSRLPCREVLGEDDLREVCTNFTRPRMIDGRYTE